MKYFLCAIALSFGVAHAEPLNIGPDKVNMTVDGASIHGGTYYGSTTFKNSAETGITLSKGDNIRGLDVVSNGIGAFNYTGHGGGIHIDAPNQVVKLDGNIDVRAFNPNDLNLTGVNTHANGGNVSVNAAYLFQNGNIYASGYNGGNVQFNVGGMTMGSGSRIDASTTSGSVPTSPTNTDSQGLGGIFKVISTGQVDIKQGATVITNGNRSWYNGGHFEYGGNNIEIVGSAVNMDGVLQATSIKYNNWTPINQLRNGGVISLVATNGDVSIGQSAIIQADGAIGTGTGGDIKVKASNDINMAGLAVANGGRGDVETFSRGNGMTGGTVSYEAGHDVSHSGRTVADGGNGLPGWFGGNAGTIVVTAQNNTSNNGVIRAMGGNTDPSVPAEMPAWPNNGGNGGTVVFNTANPQGTGSVVTFGGFGVQNGALGSITAPDPVNSTNSLYGVWKKPAP